MSNLFTLHHVLSGYTKSQDDDDCMMLMVCNETNQRYIP